jgi:hypothetical protein
MTVPLAPCGPSGITLWSTIFEDDFLTTLDTTKWYPGAVPNARTFPYTRGFNTSPNPTPPTPSGSHQVYSQAMVSVSGSICTLTCQAIPGAGTITADPSIAGVSTVYRYESGCITTNPNTPTSAHPGFTFQPSTRSVIEASIKMPSAGVGLWPAWWSSSAGTWTYEIDVAELCNSSAVPQANIHFCQDGSAWCNAQAGPHIPSSVDDLSLAFHTYTADINSDGRGQVDFYLDGTLLVSYTAPGYESAEMLLILNLALNDSSPTNLPASMDIDYVAVYQPEIPRAAPTNLRFGPAGSADGPRPGSNGVRGT